MFSSLLQHGIWIGSVSVYLEDWTISSTQFPLHFPNLCTEELSLLPAQVTTKLQSVTAVLLHKTVATSFAQLDVLLCVEFRSGGMSAGFQDHLNWKLLPKIVWYLHLAELELFCSSFLLIWFFRTSVLVEYYCCYSHIFNICKRVFLLYYLIQA